MGIWCVEECRVWSAADLGPAGLLAEVPYYPSRLPARDGQTHETVAEISVLLVHEQVFERYLVVDCARLINGERRQYLIDLTATQSTYGGLRWWFCCPKRPNGNVCGRRVAKLYLPPGAIYFGCRSCLGLAYECVHESKRQRAFRAVRKIRRRLGGADDLTEGFPAKPPRMHLATYTRLRDKAARALEWRSAPLRAQLKDALARYETGRREWLQKIQESL